MTRDTQPDMPFFRFTLWALKMHNENINQHFCGKCKRSSHSYAWILHFIPFFRFTLWALKMHNENINQHFCGKCKRSSHSYAWILHFIPSVTSLKQIYVISRATSDLKFSLFRLNIHSKKKMVTCFSSFFSRAFFEDK